MYKNIPFNIDVKDKVVKSKGFLSGLSKDELKFSIERYKKFLQLCKKHPDKALAPTKEIDEIWHLHMLSPIQYYCDCKEYFGELLDHNGGFGMIEEEFETWQQYFRDTQLLWKSEFNEEYIPNNPSPGLASMFEAATCHSNGVSVPRINKL